jgi:hypothetical protein
MTPRADWLRTLGCTIALSSAACGDDVRENAGPGDSTSSTGEPQTTIPVTSISISDTTPSSDSDVTATDATGTTDGSTSTNGDTSDTTGTTSSSRDTTDGEDTRGAIYTIDWCVLQYPTEPVFVAPSESFLVYARLYIEGLTDQSATNDLNPTVVSEFGYGDDGTQPDADASWTFVAGASNAGWDGSTVGQPNNDEYRTELAIATTGTYDFAARFSGDGGVTWTYCDLDDSLTGGYTPDQAGSVTVE